MRARAASGATLLGVRGAVIQALGIVANLALAAMLVPRDFGLVALGTVLVVVGGYVAEGGFGAALIRRDAAPSHGELRAVLGVQLTIGVVLAAGAAVAAVPAGRDGVVVAVMGAALPLMALRTPGVIMLERRLRYRVIARADIGEALAYYLWAVGAVALGFGVWGLATAVIARSAVGSAIVLVSGPVGPLVPRLEWPTVRPLLSLGMRYQGAAVAAMVRQQSVNVVIAAVAGVTTLGIWNLAWRVLQIPAVLLGNAGRVAFPAFARLIAEGANTRPLLERSAAMLGALTAVTAVGLVSLAIALPAVVGEEWADVPEVILWSSFALIIGSPMNIPAASYLLGAGEPGRVLTATLVSAAVWLAVTAVLVSEIGAVAAAVGWIACMLTSALMLVRRVAVHTGAHMLGRASLPSAFGVVAACASWLIGHMPDDELLGAAGGLIAGQALLLALLTAGSRPALADMVSLTTRGMRALRAGPANAASS